VDEVTRGGGLGAVEGVGALRQMSISVIDACLRHLTNGRDLTLSLTLVVLSRVTVNSNV
jgi:hypothetical protein